MQQPIILSTSSAISPQQERTEPSGHRPCRRGVKSSLQRESDVPGDLLRALFGNVTAPADGLMACGDDVSREMHNVLSRSNLLYGEWLKLKPYASNLKRIRISIENAVDFIPFYEDKKLRQLLVVGCELFLENGGHDRAPRRLVIKDASLLSRKQNCPGTETKEKILENPAPPCLVPSHARALRGWRCGHFVALEAKVHLGGDGSRRRIGGGGNQLCMTEIRHSNQSPRNSECWAA
jgi:hypothetical protein